MQERGHVITILEQAKQAIKEKNIVEIRSLSNKTIHSASIYQDPDNIAIAVILYSLSKFIETGKYQEYKDWPKFEKNYRDCLERAIVALKRGDMGVYRDQISCIREALAKISGNLKKYVDDVFRKASINKASRLHEHGISAEKTAKILGITVWELNQYIGQTGIADVNLAYTLELNQRIQQAEEIFEK